MEEIKNTLYKADISKLPIPDAMHNEYGFLIRWIFNRFFSKIKFEESEAEKIRNATKEGTVVYTMLSRSFLAFLYLNFIFSKSGLPLARFVNGLRLWLYQPVSKLLKLSKISIKGVTGKPSELKNRLNLLTLAGESSLIFLRKPRFLIRPNVFYDIDFIETLIETQKDSEKPIILMPILIAYHKKPTQEKQGFLDIILGERDSPTLIREIFTMLFYHRSGEVRVGEPINIKDVLNEMEGRSTDAISRRIRYLIYKNITREKTALTGPVKREPDSIGKLLINDSLVVDTINRLSLQNNVSRGYLERRAEKIIKRMVCNLDYNYIRFFDITLKAVWKLTDIKVEYNTEGIEKLRETLRRGPVVLCPMHRSHVDYLIVSQILYNNDIIVPHIAAGDNLAFWPMGHIFRKSGAYFIRRTFKGDDLYISIFRAYMKRLLKDGWTQEFFIEGTRSRTGKTLQPKFGLLTYIVDAYLDGACEDTFFVPISILYEKVIESGSYMKELLGSEKSKEDFKGLVKTTGVLTSKYGNIYVQFGEPISIKQFLFERGFFNRETDEEKKKSDILALGYRIAYEINQIATVSPSGLVCAIILSDNRRWFSADEIEDYAKFLLGIVRKRKDTKIASVLNNLSEAINQTLNRFINDRSISVKENQEGKYLYRASESRRFILDYYKNGFIHFTLNISIASASILTFKDYRCSRRDILESSKRLRDILKNEFIFKVNVDFDTEFSDSFNLALEMGFIKTENDEIILNPEYTEYAKLLSSFLTSLLESYLIAAEYTINLKDTDIDKKSLIRKIQSFGISMYDRAKIKNIESVSKVTIENAVEYLISKDILTKSDPEKKSPLLRFNPENESALKNLSNDIRKYLGY
ncbi:MAG: 1-acyl-sn-glycerol-3-phosphate acyltransferase [Deltaproteobacteria bacterium]|nr:1-acyl-sn-glycerol-3-phosphate acyltransferase [Deltaproteobacteria bacterium]